jgi:hypothetical protein
MYSWLMAPEALPSGYRRWITNASKVSPPCLPVNLERSRIGTFDPAIARKGIAVATLKNKGVIEAYAKAAEGGDFGPPFAPCSVVHPWVDTCTWTAVDRWQSVFRWMLPVYGALHVIPPILLRHKVFLKESVLISFPNLLNLTFPSPTVPKRPSPNPSSALCVPADSSRLSSLSSRVSSVRNATSTTPSTAGHPSGLSNSSSTRGTTGYQVRHPTPPSHLTALTK